MSNHCSRRTRAAFYDAANQVEGEVITLLQLMESMFELGLSSGGALKSDAEGADLCGGVGDGGVSGRVGVHERIGGGGVEPD